MHALLSSEVLNPGPLTRVPAIVFPEDERSTQSGLARPSVHHEDERDERLQIPISSSSKPSQCGTLREDVPMSCFHRYAIAPTI